MFSYGHSGCSSNTKSSSLRRSSSGSSEPPELVGVDREVRLDVMCAKSGGTKRSKNWESATLTVQMSTQNATLLSESAFKYVIAKGTCSEALMDYIQQLLHDKPAAEDEKVIAFHGYDLSILSLLPATETETKPKTKKMRLTKKRKIMGKKKKTRKKRDSGGGGGGLQFVPPRFVGDSHATSRSAGLFAGKKRKRSEMERYQFGASGQRTTTSAEVDVDVEVEVKVEHKHRMIKEEERVSQMKMSGAFLNCFAQEPANVLPEFDTSADGIVQFEASQRLVLDTSVFGRDDLIAFFRHV